MKLRLFYAVPAVLVMAASILACGAVTGQVNTSSGVTNVPAATNPPGGPTASDFVLSTDTQGTNQATVFSPTDTIYLNFSVEGAKADTKVVADWYALDIAGTDPSTPFLTYTTTVGEALGTTDLPSSGSVTLHEHLSPKPGGSLPEGHYKVVISLDDNQVDEEKFSIQQ